MSSDIDWDSVAKEADRSPRTLLAEFLAKADDIDEVIVIVTKKDKATWDYATSGDVLTCAALVRATMRDMERIIDVVGQPDGS